MTDAASTTPGGKPLLLIVDDDPSIIDTLLHSLDADFEIVTSPDRAHCLRMLHQFQRAPELALVGLGPPPPPFPRRADEGFALVADLPGFSPSIEIVVLAEQGDDDARHARALGAADFVAWPCDPDELRAVLRQALNYRALEKSRESPLTAPLIGTSAAIDKLKQQLLHYADSPFPVLIEGEPGTGKETVAGSYLHYRTKRGDKPFVALNCAAVSPARLEAALFGCAQGAFAGADAEKPGCFEEAAGGTLFLDEIGELPLEVQAGLLRVLENGAFHRVGETRERSSQARIVAASHCDLRRKVKAGRFRADLYYRLSACTVDVPALREMGADKLLLLDYFRHLYAARARRPAFDLGEEARQSWIRYGFPGNARELRNIVIRLTARCPGKIVAQDELEAELDIAEEAVADTAADPPRAAAAERPSEELLESAIARLRQAPFNLDELLAETERGYIEAARRLAKGNASQAARLLGITRAALFERMASLARSHDLP